MKLQFFTVPIHNADPVVTELNAFLATHRITQIDRQFVLSGENSAWAICVTYLDGGSRPAPEKRGTIDYRDALPEAQFRVFAKLRALRKELADKDGVPAYALFTNEQLAEMVRRPVTSMTALRKINGIGQSRAEKYGEAFLTVIRENPIIPTGDTPGAANGQAGDDEPR